MRAGLRRSFRLRAMTGSNWDRLLVGTRGWSPRLYEAWEVSALTSFLPPPRELRTGDVGAT